MENQQRSEIKKIMNMMLSDPDVNRIKGTIFFKQNYYIVKYKYILMITDAEQKRQADEIFQRYIDSITKRFKQDSIALRFEIAEIDENKLFFDINDLFSSYDRIFNRTFQKFKEQTRQERDEAIAAIGATHTMKGARERQLRQLHKKYSEYRELAKRRESMYEDRKSSILSSCEYPQEDMLYLKQDIMSNMLLDFAARWSDIFSNILMSSLIETIQTRHVDLKLFLYTSWCIDISNVKNHIVIENVLSAWIQKSNILDALSELMHGDMPKRFRAGLLFEMDHASFTTAAHEIYLCLEKENSTGYVLYIIDNISQSFYGENSPFSVLGSIARSILEKLGLRVEVMSIHNRYMHLMSFYNLDSEQPFKFIKGTGLKILNNIEYSCISASRRAAVFSAVADDLSQMYLFSEKTNPDLFYDNYLNYLQHMLRMMTWVVKSPELWHDEIEPGSKRKSASHWKAIMPSDDFIQAYNAVDVHQKKMKTKEDLAWVRDMVVPLNSTNAYLQIECESGTRLRTRRLYFQSTGEAFQDTGSSVCRVMSKFNADLTI